MGNGEDMPLERASDTVCFISCVSGKQTVAAPARELYVSTWFRLARDYVESLGCPWYVLSAEYGVVAPDTVIEPYDRTLNRMSARERREWAEDVLRQLQGLPLAGKRVIMLAGARYREPLISFLTDGAYSVEVPMEGLRIGEQLSWLRERSPRPTEYSPLAAQNSHPEHVAAPDRAALTDQLLSLNAEIGAAELFPVLEEGAAEFLVEQPYAYLLASCLNRGTRAQIIWTVPWWLSRQWGGLDPTRVAKLSDRELRESLDALPRRPRYLSAAVRAIRSLTQMIVDEYGGDARALWYDRRPSEFQETLLRVYGVGPGIANMAVQLTQRAFPGELRPEATESLDIKPDVHTRRVLYRLGAAESETDRAALAAARALHPKYPGELDGALWYAGRTWCHSSSPYCEDCPLITVCARRGLEQAARPRPTEADVMQKSSSSRPRKTRDRYGPLREYLNERCAEEVRVPLSFRDIEKIIGRELPRSARQYRPWWANQASGTHTHARAWHEAGYQVESVDLDRGSVVFVRRG